MHLQLARPSQGVAWGGVRPWTASRHNTYESNHHSREVDVPGTDAGTGAWPARLLPRAVFLISLVSIASTATRLRGLNDGLPAHAPRLGREVDTLPRALGHVPSRIAHQRHTAAHTAGPAGETGRVLVSAGRMAPTARHPGAGNGTWHGFCRQAQSQQRPTAWCRRSAATTTTTTTTIIHLGCSGMGCASTRMILPPSMRLAARSRVPCW